MYGENDSVEFEQATCDSAEFVESVVAFANSGDGVILLGVDDNANVVGVSRRSSSSAPRGPVTRRTRASCGSGLPSCLPTAGGASVSDSSERPPTLRESAASPWLCPSPCQEDRLPIFAHWALITVFLLHQLLFDSSCSIHSM